MTVVEQLLLRLLRDALDRHVLAVCFSLLRLFVRFMHRTAQNRRRLALRVSANRLRLNVRLQQRIVVLANSAQVLRDQTLERADIFENVNTSSAIFIRRLQQPHVLPGKVAARHLNLRCPL